jgi:hypothetical protein
MSLKHQSGSKAVQALLVSRQVREVIRRLLGSKWTQISLITLLRPEHS